MSSNIIPAILGGLVLPLTLVISRILIFKIEGKLSGKARQLYKNGIFVWIEKKHYRFIVPIILFSIGYTFVYYLLYRSSSLILLEILFVTQLLTALLKKDKMTTALNLVNLIIFFWTMGGGYIDTTLPFLRNWEFFRHKTPTTIYPEDFFLVMTSIFFTIMFCIGLFVKKEEVLDSPQFTLIEQEKIKEHLKQNPQL